MKELTTKRKLKMIANIRHLITINMYSGLCYAFRHCVESNKLRVTTVNIQPIMQVLFPELYSSIKYHQLRVNGKLINNDIGNSFIRSHDNQSYIDKKYEDDYIVSVGYRLTMLDKIEARLKKGLKK